MRLSILVSLPMALVAMHKYTPVSLSNGDWSVKETIMELVVFSWREVPLGKTFCRLRLRRGGMVPGATLHLMVKEEYWIAFAVAMIPLSPGKPVICGEPCTTTVVELLMPSSGSLLVKEHVYTPPSPLPTLVTMRVLLTTPCCVTLVMVTLPVTFCGKVQEGIRVGDGEEATQLRERFVFSMTLVTLPRETIKDGPTVVRLVVLDELLAPPTLIVHPYGP